MAVVEPSLVFRHQTARIAGATARPPARPPRRGCRCGPADWNRHAGRQNARHRCRRTDNSRRRGPDRLRLCAGSSGHSRRTRTPGRRPAPAAGSARPGRRCRARRRFSASWSCTTSKRSGSTIAGTGTVIHSSGATPAGRWLRRGVALPPRTGRSRAGRGSAAGLAEAGLALVGRVLEHVPDHAAGPPAPAGARAMPGPLQPPADLADAQAVAPDPVEDLPHHGGLLLDHLVAGQAPARGLAGVAVAVRARRSGR